MTTQNTWAVEKTALQNGTWLSVEAPALQPGQVRLHIERFAFTANNITYAAFGEAMKYWQFYPVSDSHGVIPVWGFATVVESAQADVPLGDRFYGYYPFADSVVLTPSRCTPNGFVDAAPQRAELAAVYNAYTRCSTDAFYTAGTEDIQCLLRPLFITSWLIDDFFADNQDFGATTIIMSSASSKTAYGSAYAFAQRAKASGITVVGLTSANNRAYVQGLGCYDTVLAYDELDLIPADAACAYIDFAGNAKLRHSIHSRFANLKYSCSVGGTHVQALGGARDLPGPKATLFFAPAQIKKRAAEWGGAVFNQRLVQAWQAFSTHVQTAKPEWLQVQTHQGLDAAQTAYQTVLKGGGDPVLGHVVVM